MLAASGDGRREESLREATTNSEWRNVPCRKHADLMQRLSRFPSAPDVTLLDRRKPKPFSWLHTTPPLESRLTSDGVASTYRMHRVNQALARSVTRNLFRQACDNSGTRSDIRRKVLLVKLCSAFGVIPLARRWSSRVPQCIPTRNIAAPKVAPK